MKQKNNVKFHPSDLKLLNQNRFLTKEKNSEQREEGMERGRKGGREEKKTIGLP